MRSLWKALGALAALVVAILTGRVIRDRLNASKRRRIDDSEARARKARRDEEDRRALIESAETRIVEERARRKEAEAADEDSKSLLDDLNADPE